MAEWYDTFSNESNFFRWADAEGKTLSEIQRPELFCLGKQSTAVTTNTVPEVYENKNNFFRWINLEGRTLDELQDYFCSVGGDRAYSDGYDDGYS